MKGVFELIIIQVILLMVFCQNNEHQSSKSFNESSLFSTELCDLITEGGICLFNGEKVLTSDAQPKGLIGHWSFDDAYALDHSGNKNHAKRPLPAGPAYGGIGASALFNGFDYLEIPHSNDFTSKVYSVTFWLYLVKEYTEDLKQKKGLRWCPILQKGVDDTYENIYFRSPALFFDRKERILKTIITTTAATTQPQGEMLFSNAKIPYQRWTHIAILVTESKVKLYVNGILDAVNATEGHPTINDMSLFVGNTPWHIEDCNIPSYIDELRFYNRALYEEEIEAEAAPALGGVEPSYVNLGCINCGLDQANKACMDGYHLCTSIELHTGGYQVARAMGWIDWNSNVWSHGALTKKEDKGSSNGGENTGLGICCADLK